MHDVRQLVGKRVQLLRKRKGYSQEALAGRIGIDTKSLSRLERGAHYPSLETLDRIRLELDVELKDFFDFTNEPSAEEMRDYLIRTVSSADYSALVQMVSVVRGTIRGKD
ncbi:helix-turn-helix domain-containing protein [Herbaspirillum rhizosphaerae]|uniref:helix-turn-helix domain-containing protein n=1 Tax=Herbaspirillum rhizosphaerae TaxID=346179 RepID=UPI0009FB35DE